MMNDEKKEQLLKDLKLKLKITWDNDKDTAELSSIIADAEYTMNHKLGAEIDYSASGLYHNIFMNYCWYVHNGCDNEFDDAYRKEILMLRGKCEVTAYETTEADTDTE